MKIVVGTRGSKLALTQTKWVINELEKFHKEVTFEMKIIKTKGDRVQHIALDQIGDKALFVKELEEELLCGEIDMAVHSMKDMPSSLPEGLTFSYRPKREDARDVLILKQGYTSLDELPQEATIATGSKRRAFQLLNLRPDLCIAPIRGNIDTRLKKLETENFDGIVLAAAGLHRLGLKDKITSYLSVEEMVPAPGQGSLAIEIRKNDKEVENLMFPLYDEVSDYTVEAERGFMDGLNGSCHMPMGAYATLCGEELTLTGLYGDEEGHKLVKKSMSDNKQNARKLGLKLAEEVIKEFK